MNRIDKDIWLETRYPLTVVYDRYVGTYSKGEYLAFPLEFNEVPEEVNGGDDECDYFWGHYDEPVGKGATVQKAIDDLVEKMKEKEIEDERIRKELVNFILYKVGHLLDEETEHRFVAYLEKQKTSEEAIRYVKENHSPDEVSDFQAAMNIAVAKAYDKGVQDTLKKQKEQKDYRKLYEDIAKSEWFKKAYVGKSLGEDEQKEQKPVDTTEIAHCINCPVYEKAEWSEEDEKMLNELITIMDGGKVTSGTYLSEYVAWLKSLRPQPKQEWTEEDEEMLVSIINDIKGYDAYVGTIATNFEAHKKRIAWLNNRLKSLRPQPHWKPSEKQMEALLDASEINAYIFHATLKSLYADLKKLMEE